ncbi:hypothetical protein LCGC14_1931820 [marine sediment metagenome]|uniref:DNA (cytosine-5-)-methyltransferase n=1 Tax=marine sediment metagenome TaxID=412755 RepID=A0A0F9IKF3_9ZZZZ
MKNKFPYNWKLDNGFPAKTVDYHGSTVFSCFGGGGGSSMGYKLAGYNVLGCTEIDSKIMDLYKINLNPKYSFLEAIQIFKKRKKKHFPKELRNLDILDGSPPCSSFSMAGNREKDWGKKKKFREGQVSQVLDTLFFDFIDLAEKLQPKIVVAENVKGILMGAAMGYKINYVDQIYKAFDRAEYICNHWLLDASKMGVPQRRERVFFIALRKDLINRIGTIDLFRNRLKLNLYFSEKSILFKEIYNGDKGKLLNGKYLELWNLTKVGDSFQKVANGSWFSKIKLSMNKVLPTLTAHASNDLTLSHIPYRIDSNSLIIAASFPLDYQFIKSESGYITGMSVPPIMMAQVANQIYLQWLLKINKYENKKTTITRSIGNRKAGISQ